MKVTISEDSLYGMERLVAAIKSWSGIVWTKPMQRLFTLVSRALKHNEPVLLVGETGTGKTSVCQLYADIVGKQLKTVNGHQNLEAADIIGGQRPNRHDDDSREDVLNEATRLLVGILKEPILSVFEDT